MERYRVIGMQSFPAHEGGKAYDSSMGTNCCVGLDGPCTDGVSEECRESESRFHHGHAWANERALINLRATRERGGYERRQHKAPVHEVVTGASNTVGVVEA